MRLLFIAFCISFFSCAGTSKIPIVKLEWITIEALENKMNDEKRPVLISLYTDWCGWCKKMDKKVYTNPDLVKFVNDNFYAIKFDGEFKAPITFKGRTFNYRTDLRIHELTLYLTRGDVGFPATVFLYDLEDDPAPVTGYLNVKQIELLIKFYAEGKGSDWKSFQQNFKNTW